MLLYQIILTGHLVASTVWVGAVFMGTFIDWPSARASVPERRFPFRFIVGQGRRVFYSVYSGITILWVTGLALVVLRPPTTGWELSAVLFKVAALFFMTAFTLYGTLRTWPKLQLATDEEAYHHYKFYMYRAVGTFTFGLLAAIAGLWVRP